MTSNQTRPKLYALLVGIDAYPPPITPLHGCVNDLNKLRGYLEGNTAFFDLKLLALTNQEATKEGVVRGFTDHLGLSQKGDTVLFYYSGHGTQEDADPVFWMGEEDKKLEALVCYDSVGITAGSPKMDLLVDKELRFLIHEIAKNDPHIVTIFDCCHSGGNTRNGNFTDSTGPDGTEQAIARRLSMAFPARDWKDFIFGKAISREDMKEIGIQKALPEGRHLQISACQNDESSYEFKGEGVFTKNMIDILQRCHGNITYHRLQSTIQNYLRHQFSQTPKIYSTGGNAILFNCFLNKEAEERAIEGSVAFNDTLGWILDMGSIQGIVPETEIMLRMENKATSYPATIKTVNVTYSTVELQAIHDKALPKGTVFSCEIQSFLSHALMVYPEGPTLGPEILAMFTGRIQTSRNLSIAKALNAADYCVNKRGSDIRLARAGSPDIPLVPGIPGKGFGKEQLEQVIGYIDHLANYTFVRYLTNPASFLLHPNMISLTIYGNGDTQTPIPAHGEEVVLRYERKGADWRGSIRIRLVNKSDRKLYCALCYLSFNFGVYTTVIPTGVAGLDPGSEIWAMDGNPIHFKLEPEVTALRYSESTSYLKLLVSTEDFTQQLNTLFLEDLPGPLSGPSERTRGLELRKEPGVVHDWTTRLITLRMPNPEFPVS